MATEQELRMKAYGMANVLCECAVYVQDPDLRDMLDMALDDFAQTYGCKIKHVLDRREIVLPHTDTAKEGV